MRLVGCGVVLVLVACSGGAVSQGSSGGTTGAGSSGSSGSSSGGSSGSAAAATYASFCAHYPEAACAFGQACLLVDPAVDCSTAPAVTNCAAPSYYHYDPAQGAACLALFSSGSGSAACSTTAALGLEPDGGAPCAAAVQPGVPWGGACEAAAGQCAPPTDGGPVFCVAPPDSCGGTCGLGAGLGESCDLGGCAQGYCNARYQLCMAYGNLGDECTGELDACEPTTAYCIFPPDAGYDRQYCTPRVESGGLCFIDGCVDGFTCLSPDGGFLTSCQPQAGVGEACSPSIVDDCQSGLTCFDGSCSATPAPAGSPCGVADAIPLGCSPGEYCENPDGGVGVCTARRTTAGSCDETAACPEGMVCALGGCAPFAIPLGATCSPNQVCTGGYCAYTRASAGTCTAFVSAGQACVANVQCAFPTLCVGGTCATPPAAGRPCASAGSAFFPAGCAEGDLCVSGTCTHQGALGDPCQLVAGGSTCAAGRCDPTGHCAAFLDVGAICAPTAFECSALQRAVALGDGGLSARDAACVLPPDGGATVCAAVCE